MTTRSSAESEGMTPDYARRHLRFGWWSLLLFTVLGLGLEILHGYKVSAYVDASNETRRLMWTLAHAHGTLLGLVHVLFGLTVRMAPDMAARSRPLISWGLIGASVLLPGGFFLGGIAFYGGDPGLSVLLVPVGAVGLMIAIFALGRHVPSEEDAGKSGGSGGTARAKRQ
jgi:hypothetical protein